LTAPKSPSNEPIIAVVTIVNRRGLHARAAAKFCAVAGAYDAAVRVVKDDITVGGRSIMGLLMLGAGAGSTVKIVATGLQASEVADALVRLVADKFGEGE